MDDIRNGTCPLCEHDEIVKGVPAVFGEGNAELTACFTYDARWLLSGRDPRHGHGPLAFYMCRQCGYLQWFVEQPESVPVGDEHRTSLVTPKSKKAPAYR